MSIPYCCGLSVCNNSEQPILLWIEPWAEEFTIDPEEEICVEFDGPEKGHVVANYIPGGLQVYAFNRSRAIVKKNGLIIWEAHERLPA